MIESVTGASSEVLERKSLREDETITIGPTGVLGVESHEAVEKDVGDWRHSHWRARVPGVGCESGIHGQEADRVDA